MGAILGFIGGIVATCCLFVYLSWHEWRDRVRLQNKVDRLHKHLSCGGGILGCPGGPKCDWDHK